jgi:hypothetical protein
MAFVTRSCHAKCPARCTAITDKRGLCRFCQFGLLGNSPKHQAPNATLQMKRRGYLYPDNPLSQAIPLLATAHLLPLLCPMLSLPLDPLLTGRY